MRLWIVSGFCLFLQVQAEIETFLGSCENVVLWRGHFNATGEEKSVNLSINGGEGLLVFNPFVDVWRC